jgi:hypothetical protein
MEHPVVRTGRGKRVLIGVGIVLVALIALAGLLYEFGGMWPPSEASRAAYASMVSRGEQPAVESRFTIPIPGCVCHTDDPVLQMQHAGRRISECAACHSRS